ncbi:MAG: hypothetical protein ACK4I8_02080 [Armatimonadota bacterium]
MSVEEQFAATPINLGSAKVKFGLKVATKLVLDAGKNALRAEKR